MAYDAKAQEFVFNFFLRGWSRDRALPKIREVYPGFAASTWDEWEKKHDWKYRRAAADAKAREFEDLLADTPRVLVTDLELQRQALLKAMKEAPTVDPQMIYALNAVSKHITDISVKFLATRDPIRISAEHTGEIVEKLLTELREIPGVGKALAANAEKVGTVVTRVAEAHGA